MQTRAQINIMINQRNHLPTHLNLVKIHDLIRSGSYPSLSNFVEKLQRNERSIKRYLSYLRNDFHAPIHYDRQKNGYYYLDPNWQIPPVKFNEGEILAFFTAERFLKQIGKNPESSLLRTALAKLATYLPEQISIEPAMLELTTSFQLLPTVEVDARTLQLLSHAAIHKITVKFDYFSQYKAELSPRRANPLLIHNFAGDWYAVSLDTEKNETRDFHVGRITNLELTNDFFELPNNWNADDYLKRGFFMTRGGRLTTVEIVFDSYQARWIRERGPFHLGEQREELPNGELKLLFQVGKNGLEAVARFCLTYAGHCRAKQPPELRKIILEKLEKSIKDHSY